MRGGANNYLKDIEFKLINPYITTNKEIAEEFKKDPQSIKNYVEIINPKKHDLNIEKVEAIDTDTIKLDVSFFQNGEKIGPAVKKLNGLRDSTKPWTDEELAVLFKHMLEQSKNNIKEFIDLSSVKDKFPSDVNVIKFNSDNIASRKIPNILFEATINSDSIDDVNGTLSLSISLRSKIPSGYSIYNAKHNIDLGPVDGLWSWNKIISDIKEEDLELPKNSNEFLLPSSCDTKSIKIKKGSNFQNKYNDIEITFDPVSHSQNDDWNGIKNITFNLNYKNKKVSPKANLSLKNFYSLYKLQELISEKNINIPEFPHLLPSKYSDSDIKLKNELLLLKNNPNLKIIKKLLADDTNGILNVDITLIDEKNNLNYHKNFVLTGFYSTKKFDDLKNNLDIENSDEPSIPHLLPSKYEINNIKLKSESLLLKNNPNLKIIKKLLVDDANGILNVDITLIDEKNNLNYHKNFVLTGFYSTKKFDDLKNNLDIENSDEPSIPHLLPSKYEINNIKLKSESLLLKNNPNLKIIKKLLVDDANGILNVDITLIDEKNNLNYHKNFVLTGFYSTKKFDDLKNNLDIENRDDPSIPYLLPSKYDTNNIKLKNESLLLKSNPNLKIDKKITTNDNDGIMSISIILRDSLNNLEYSKVLEIRNFYSKTAFHQQIAELSEDDLNITVNRKMRPSDYHFDYSKPINLKDNSSLLAKNPNLKIIKYKKVSVISHSNARGTLKIHIWVADEKNNLYNDKDIEITGFAKQEWTVQELDYLVDKIMTTPISQGKYILTTITGIPSFSGAKYRNLYLKQSYYSNFLTFEIDEEHKDIQSPSLNWMIEKTFLMIRVHKKDEPENVKVRWKVKGEEKILTARKQWYQLYGTHGLKKSTKFITIYVIYHSDKSNYFDVDINVQEL